MLEVKKKAPKMRRWKSSWTKGRRAWSYSTGLLLPCGVTTRPLELGPILTGVTFCFPLLGEN